MKKMRFTLGLMLSMLILGANVSYAQNPYEDGYPHRGLLTVSATVKPCDFFNSDVRIDLVSEDNKPGTTSYSINGIRYSAAEKVYYYMSTGGPMNESNRWYQWYSMTYGRWSLYPDTWFTWSSTAATGALVNSNKDFYFDYALNEWIPYNGEGNLLYYLKKDNTKAYNRIQVELKYIEGNELQPIVIRKITFGRWETVRNPSNANQRRNDLIYDGGWVEQVIDPDTAWFRPYMDRMNDVAYYVYEDQILPLLLNNPPIYSIEYFISVHDEFDTPGGNDYQPPVGADVTVTRSIQIFPEIGIKTDPSTLGSVLYVPANKEFTFKVFSDKDINVIAEAANPSVKLPPGRLVTWELTGFNTYTVTIRSVQHNLNIYVTAANSSSGEGDGDQTGNLALGKNFAYAALGTLYVQTDSPATLSIYNVTGQLVKQMQVTGNTSLPLPKGLYIVQLNGKAYKVIN